MQDWFQCDRCKTMYKKEIDELFKLPKDTDFTFVRGRRRPLSLCDDCYKIASNWFEEFMGK